MAIISLKQNVTIMRGGDPDEWGNAIPGETLTLKCRIEEGLKLQQYRSIGTTESEVVVATARILFDKLADIRETDTIVYVNELGITIEKIPKEINIKRNMSGKPIFTEVVI